MDNIKNSDVFTLATESHDQRYTKQFNTDNNKQIDNSYDIKSADFYQMEKLSSGFNEIWDTKSLEKELFKLDDYNNTKEISADKLISDYVTVYDKQGLNDLKDKYGSVTSSAPNRFIRHTRPVPKSFGNKHIEARKDFFPNHNKNSSKNVKNNGHHASDRIDTNIGYRSKNKIPSKQSKKPVKEIAANKLQMFSKKRIIDNALMHRKPRLRAFDRRNIQKNPNAQNFMKRNGFSSRQGVGDVTNILGDTIRNSIPFVGNNIADLVFPTQATSQRPDPSFGTERQALLSGDGYDQMLVLLRPPPRRQPLSLLSQYIDIDYELFVILLGIAGAGAAFALNQVIIK